MATKAILKARIKALRKHLKRVRKELDKLKGYDVSRRRY